MEDWRLGALVGSIPFLAIAFLSTGLPGRPYLDVSPIGIGCGVIGVALLLAALIFRGDGGRRHGEGPHGGRFDIFFLLDFGRSVGRGLRESKGALSGATSPDRPDDEEEVDGERELAARERRLEERERDRQWPLTAAGTQLLLAMPASNAKPRPEWAYGLAWGSTSLLEPKDSVKLGLKELIVRGAYRVDIQQGRWGSWGSQKVTLLRREPALPRGVLPRALHSFDAALRPWAPAEIKDVIRRARKANPKLIFDLGELFQAELSDRGLIASHRGKLLGLFPVTKWSRTASGDVWAATGAHHLDRLASLPVEVERDPQSAGRVAAVAGALTLMDPAAMAAVARLHRRGASRGLGMGFPYYSEEAGFNPFDAIGDLFDSVLEGNLERAPPAHARGRGSLDARIDAFDSALDSVAASIDSGVDSGVDAGGGDGGGGDGGGGE